MGIFDIFSKRKRLETAFSHMHEFERQKPQLIRSLALKRLTAIEADSDEERVAGAVAVGQLNDDQIVAIPEATIVTITSLYDQQVAAGMTPRAALLFVDGMRPPPLPRNIDERMTLEDYIEQKIDQELGDGEPSYRHGDWEHGQDFIPSCIAETRAVVQRIKTGAVRLKGSVPPPLPASRVPSQKEMAKFYREKHVLSDFGAPQVSPRTQAQILAYFLEHPGWRLLPRDVLAELSNRVADRSRNWLTYDVDHALEILIFMTEKSNALVHNFLPICRDKEAGPMNTPETKLYLFAMTFEKLASKYVRELQEHGARLTDAKMAEGLEDAKAYAEAALTCDRYFLTSFMPAAWAWVMKNGDVDRAVQILDEGIHWARAMGRARPHKASLFDEQFIKEPDEHIQFLEETKQSIMELK